MEGSEVVDDDDEDWVVAVTTVGGAAAVGGWAVAPWDKAEREDGGEESGWRGEGEMVQQSCF